MSAVKKAYTTLTLLLCCTRLGLIRQNNVKKIKYVDWDTSLGQLLNDMSMYSFC